MYLETTEAEGEIKMKNHNFKLYGIHIISNGLYLHNFPWNKAPVSNTWIPMSLFFFTENIFLPWQIFCSYFDSELEMNSLECDGWECGGVFLQLKNNELSESEQWWHDINVIKSCRVMPRTFPLLILTHLLTSLLSSSIHSRVHWM